MRVTAIAVVLSSLLASEGFAQTPTRAPAGSTPSSTTTGTGTAPAGTPAVDPATVAPEQMPVAIRMRRLEQRTQAIKERAWQLKARVAMLKEQLVGGGVGAQSLISHANEMGSSFRLIKLVYSLDGTQVFARSDEASESLYKTKSFDIFAGPIAPGTHTIAAVATYRGHGYNVFEYLTKYTFTAKGNQSFTAGEGKISKVDCKGLERGGPTTPLEKRPAITCVITQVTPERAAEAAPAAPAPATTPAPTPGQ